MTMLVEAPRFVTPALLAGEVSKMADLQTGYAFQQLTGETLPQEIGKGGVIVTAEQLRAQAKTVRTLENTLVKSEGTEIVSEIEIVHGIQDAPLSPLEQHIADTGDY
jgi:hypothetical protein